jgi:hypothetical protein
LDLKRTKKAMIEFVKVNGLDVKTIHSDTDFTQYITKKFKIFNQLEEIMTMHNKRQAVLEERKPKPKPVNYTTKFRIFQIVDENEDEKIGIGGKYTTARGPDGRLYVSTYLVHLNVIDPLIVQYAMGNGRTYITDEDRWTKLWNIMLSDENCPSRNMSSGFDLVVVTDVQIPNLIYYDIFKPKESKLWATDNEVGICHKYINYNINKEAKSFNELFSIKQCDYVQENYKANSWFVNILVDSFHKSFINNKHYKFNATYEDFCDLLDVEMKTDNIGLTINKSLVFFKKFGIKLCAIGRFGIIEMYKPEKTKQKVDKLDLFFKIFRVTFGETDDKDVHFLTTVIKILNDNGKIKARSLTSKILHFLKGILLKKKLMTRFTTARKVSLSSIVTIITLLVLLHIVSLNKY